MAGTLSSTQQCGQSTQPVPVDLCWFPASSCPVACVLRGSLVHGTRHTKEHGVVFCFKIAYYRFTVQLLHTMAQASLNVFDLPLLFFSCCKAKDLVVLKTCCSRKDEIQSSTTWVLVELESALLLVTAVPLGLVWLVQIELTCLSLPWPS